MEIILIINSWPENAHRNQSKSNQTGGKNFCPRMDVLDRFCVVRQSIFTFGTVTCYSKVLAGQNMDVKLVLVLDIKGS